MSNTPKIEGVLSRTITDEHGQDHSYSFWAFGGIKGIVMRRKMMPLIDGLIDAIFAGLILKRDAEGGIRPDFDLDALPVAIRRLARGLDAILEPTIICELLVGTVRDGVKLETAAGKPSAQAVDKAYTGRQAELYEAIVWVVWHNYGGLIRRNVERFGINWGEITAASRDSVSGLVGLSGGKAVA